MRAFLYAVWAATVASPVLAQDSVKFQDPLTGFTFSQFNSEAGISFAVAVPANVVADQPYDVVVQMTAEKDIAWYGMAWGGSMTYNPIAFAHPNGDQVSLTSRIAFGYYVPVTYPDAAYHVLPAGTFVNDTHWQVTAKCTGCSQWGDQDIGITYLDPAQDQYLAYAISMTPVDDPDDPETSFSIHKETGHFVHSFPDGANPDFEELLLKNSVVESGADGDPSLPHASPAPCTAPSFPRRTRQ